MTHPAHSCDDCGTSHIPWAAHELEAQRYARLDELAGRLTYEASALTATLRTHRLADDGLDHLPAVLGVIANIAPRSTTGGHELPECRIDLALVASCINEVADRNTGRVRGALREISYRLDLLGGQLVALHDVAFPGRSLAVEP